MTHKLRLSLRGSHAPLLYHALRYEEAPRAHIHFSLEKDTVSLECETNSIANLRATSNSILQWIAMIEETSTMLDLLNRKWQRAHHVVIPTFIGTNLILNAFPRHIRYAVSAWIDNLISRCLSKHQYTYRYHAYQIVFMPWRKHSCGVKGENDPFSTIWFMRIIRKAITKSDSLRLILQNYLNLHIFLPGL